MNLKKISSDVLVIGAGISGISAALETAETGYSVTLLEKLPYVGGRVAQLNHYFPKLCPPSCGLEINFRRIKDNDLISLFTMAEVTQISGEPGAYKVKFTVKPRYVKQYNDSIDNYIAEMNVKRTNDFNYGLNENKAVYRPYENSYPQKYVFDKDSISVEDAKFIADNYKDAIDLTEEEQYFELETKSVVWATGWKPYDANKLDTLGYKENKEVITNVEMERFAAPGGPTAGKIVVPGSDREVASVAFVQCAGSRDENHLEYCSSICCLASMKQARYVREQYPDAEIHIFYIDLRTPGIFEDFYNDTKEDEKIFFHRGKVAKVFKPHGEQQLVVEAENTLTGELTQKAVDMVVLATGMEPDSETAKKLAPELLDSNGFVKANLEYGTFGCGVCVRPKDVASSVQEATGAAIKAIHTIKGNK